MTFRRSLVLLLSMSLCLAAVVSAQCDPSEISIAADRDNTLYEDAGGALSNGAGSYVFTGNTSGNGVRRALLRFDVAGAVPPGSTITSAALALNMSMAISGPENVDLHRVTADWGEGSSDAGGPEGGGTASTPGDATWIHTFFNTALWTAPGGDFSAAPSAAALVDGTGVYVWGSSAGMVADTQTWLDDPASNFGWILVGNEAVLGTAKRFDSRSGPLPPVLCVAAAAPAILTVPTLGSLGLALLASVLGVVALRRLGAS